jgi:hypothetical protein
LSVIDVPGIQAKGAMVSMMTSTGQWTDKTATMPTFKHLVGRLTIARLAAILRAASLTICSIFFTIVELFVGLSVFLLQTQELLA